MNHFDSEAEYDPNIGMVLDGRYLIEDPIGAGATGVVYRGVQTKVDRKVAIKLLKKKYSQNEQLRQRFEIEARAVAKLKDPHCIRLFDYGYDAEVDRLYMVFDYVDGQSLEELLPGPVPVDTALSFVVQIASALNHAHQLGILHRDLKPSNVLLQRTTHGDRARVVDFGLARISGDTDVQRLTAHGDRCGTPAYMSPEQCLGQRDVDSSADIYSLGCMAYELIEGRIPYSEGTIAAIMQAHLTEPIPPITAPEVSESVKRMIQQMMHKKADQRPSAADVIELIAPQLDLDVSMEMQLGAATRSGEFAAYEPESDDAVEPPGGSASMRMAMLLGAFLAVLILVFVAVAAG